MENECFGDHCNVCVCMPISTIESVGQLGNLVISTCYWMT